MRYLNEIVKNQIWIKRNSSWGKRGTAFGIKIEFTPVTGIYLQSKDAPHFYVVGILRASEAEVYLCAEDDWRGGLNLNLFWVGSQGRAELSEMSSFNLLLKQLYTTKDELDSLLTTTVINPRFSYGPH